MKYLTVKPIGSYRSLKETNAKLFSENNRLKGIILKERLESIILTKSESDISVIEIEQLSGLKFETNNFVFLHIGLKHQFSLKSENSFINEFDKIEHIFTSLLNEFAVTIFFNAKNSIGCLVNFHNINESNKENIEILIDSLTDRSKTAAIQSKKQYGIDLSVSISMMFTDLSYLKKAYRNAIIVRDYSFDIEESVISYFDIDWEKKRKVALNDTGFKELGQDDLPILERQFMNYVLGKKYYEAVTTLDSITNINIWHFQVPLEHIVSSMFFRLEMVIAITGLDNNPEVSEWSSVYKALENLMNARTFRQMRDTVYDIFALLDDILNSQNTKYNKTDAVKKFIQNNYNNPSLGGAMICKQFKFSLSYLSRIFRNETGGGLVDYIHSIRLDEAKRLLKETGLTIDDIAEQVGFLNRWTLIRIFKNSEGITPGLYRKTTRS